MKKVSLLFAVTFMCIAATAQHTTGQINPKLAEQAARTTDVQVLNIPQGWSGISGYILPENTDIETLFQAAIF